MDNVLVVSAAEKSTKSICSLVDTYQKNKFTCVTSINEAKRLINYNDYSLILINAPLPDEFGTDFSLEAVSNTLSGVILMVKSELSSQTHDKVDNFGVMVIEKPVNRALFLQSIALVKATEKRMRVFKKENVKLKNQIEEIRILNRAKSTLMKYLNLTEPQAHKFIVKQAMDLRITKAEVAMNILKTYEM